MSTWLTPVSGFLTVTVTPGSMPPVESETAPIREPRGSWAYSGELSPATSIVSHISRRNGTRIMLLPEIASIIEAPTRGAAGTTSHGPAGA
jgi:hypothetical protein